MDKKYEDAEILDKEGIELLFRKAEENSIEEFEKLNVDTAVIETVSESNGSQGWADMVNRLKAGEDIPGIALAPNGNVVFLVLD